jgi:hypothetical protein
MNLSDALVLRNSPTLVLGALLASAIVACGGGSGGAISTGGNGAGSGTSGTISGTASKGPVSGAMVTAYAVNDGVKGGQLATAQTNASGDFTMTVGAYSGPMMLEVHGGSYTDEATGSRMNMLDADDMTCVLPSVTVAAGSMTTGIQVTPLTSMAQVWAQNMAGGMTMSNITMANSQIGTDYLGTGVDIVMTHPIDPTVSGSANGVSIDSKNYGMLLAAMSQEAHDLGMTQSSSAIITALMSDASDGMMDGWMGGTAIDMSGMGGMMGGGKMMSTTGTGQLATAMATFVNNLAMNKSGVISVTEMQAMMDRLNQLAASGGHL